MMQKRKHHGQHDKHDGKVRQQPGRTCAGEDATVH